MASPKNLGGVDLSAATAANVFTGSTNGNSFSVTVVNRGTVDAKVRLGFSGTTATFENANFIEFDVTIPAKGVLERTGLIIESSSFFFVAQSDVTSVNVTAYGLEF